MRKPEIEELIHFKMKSHDHTKVPKGNQSILCSNFLYTENMYCLSRVTRWENFQFILAEIGIPIVNDTLMNVQLIYLKHETCESHNMYS